MKLNTHFEQLPQTYLFTEVAIRSKQYKDTHPDAQLLRMGIGDISEPICPVAIEALHKAVDELAQRETLRGYGPEVGYGFLREAICRDYAQQGIHFNKHEIFVSDGASSDIGNLGDLFATDNHIAIPDPYYPAYMDSNIIDGRKQIELLPCTAANDFVPDLPQHKADIIYLCYPNNPTGICLTRMELQQWVSYALDNQSLIIFDGAYEAFITDPAIPHSIYEIEGAKYCAIELRSFSKTAGFTSLRCGYTVIPQDLKELNNFWRRRQCTKFSGAAYIVQRAAEATLTEEGKRQTQTDIQHYLHNAQMLREGLQSLGFTVYGGVNAPYLWMQCANGLSSWQMFDLLLDKCQLVTTPGCGFGHCGEGYLRLSGFADTASCKEALTRLKRL